jgi:microcystin-dependent protein
VAQPYIGEIRMFGGGYEPAGWMFCEGQLLPIADNDALFSLIGTTYGGDGQTNFALPDLRGRVPIHQGGGFTLGQNGGVENVTLSIQQLPVHSHPVLASVNVAQDTSPAGKILGQIGGGALPYIQDTPDTSLSNQAVSSIDGGQPHTNFQPYLCINFIISLFGIFPTPT